MLVNIKYYHNMQYQVDPTDLTQENDKKTLFWHFGSFKNEFLWFLNGPSWPGDVAKCWKTLSSITICNIKSIEQTKLLKIAKNLFFGTLDHSKLHFCNFSMILHDLVNLPNVEKHLLLSQYAIWSRSNRPNSRKRPKTSLFTFWIIQKCIFVTFEWSSMTW